MDNLIKIFSHEANFIAGAATIDAIPAGNLPEFAFIGRSNVGKSSLINALLGRKSLTRVSQTPGCTKQINFFNVGDKLSIVDLPGYGFAKISNQDRNAWNTLIHHYLRYRKQLKRVFLLIDSRHALKEVDEKTMSFLDEFAISYQIVLTKTDKPSDAQNTTLVTELKQLITKHAACHPDIILSSSVSKTGIDQLQKSIVGNK